jgi:hypothetical protein
MAKSVNCDHAITFRESDGISTFETCQQCGAYRMKLPHQPWTDWAG